MPRLAPASPETERAAEIAREFTALVTRAAELGVGLDVRVRGDEVRYFPVVPPGRGIDAQTARDALQEAVERAHEPEIPRKLAAVVTTLPDAPTNRVDGHRSE